MEELQLRIDELERHIQCLMTTAYTQATIDELIQLERELKSKLSPQELEFLGIYETLRRYKEKNEKPLLLLSAASALVADEEQIQKQASLARSIKANLKELDSPDHTEILQYEPRIRKIIEYRRPFQMEYDKIEQRATEILNRFSDEATQLSKKFIQYHDELADIEAVIWP
ncbi:MAG: hypothetical protein EZS28_018144 [Streblomastix strix]|uniref:Uncharacterized protein n=1 Tax=Streblomastix strix TaxID=222440 RepID=A0A5J4VVN0_9EUKA|nr:MAG: hypothetical protein EZS28_018144 [Streblomastix strix]